MSEEVTDLMAAFKASLEPDAIQRRIEEHDRREQERSIADGRDRAKKAERDAFQNAEEWKIACSRAEKAEAERENLIAELARVEALLAEVHQVASRGRAEAISPGALINIAAYELLVIQQKTAGYGDAE